MTKQTLTRIDTNHFDAIIESEKRCTKIVPWKEICRVDVASIRRKQYNTYALWIKGLHEAPEGPQSVGRVSERRPPLANHLAQTQVR